MGSKKKGINGLSHTIEVESQMWMTKRWFPGDKRKRDELGDWDEHIHTNTCKTDN